MTSKKSKINELTHKTDFTKYHPKVVNRKKQNTKRIETFLPISNQETPKKAYPTK